MYELTEADQKTVRDYSRLCDAVKMWRFMTWKGRDVAKTPNDMWLYQEVMSSLRPSVIVEFGTAAGGSALFYADMMDVLDIRGGRVVTIDKVEREWIEHPRVLQLCGMSRHDEIIEQVFRVAKAAIGPVMIVEDSEHTYHNTRGELEIYSPLVTVGSYFVVEDLSYPEECSPVRRAVDEFLLEHLNFDVDATMDRFLIGVAPGGWLKRIK